MTIASPDVPKHLPTTTVLLPRLPIFEPTFLPNVRAGEWFESPAGRCRVTGRLGQRHEAALEAVLKRACKKHVGRKPDGTVDYIDVVVDPARVRKTLARRGAKDGYSYAGLCKLLDDLQTALIEIVSRRNGVQITSKGSLIERRTALEDEALPDPLSPRAHDHARSRGRRDGRPSTHTSLAAGLQGVEHGARRMIVVRLGEAWVKLVGVDIPRYWDPKDFAGLTTGIAQALARWVWTQRNTPNGGWMLDTIIRAVTPNAVAGYLLRKRKVEVRRAAPALSELGITITDSDRVLYDGRMARAVASIDPPARSVPSTSGG